MLRKLSALNCIDSNMPLEERRGICLVERLGLEAARKALDVYMSEASYKLNAANVPMEYQVSEINFMDGRTLSKCHRLKLGIEVVSREERCPKAARKRLLGRRIAMRKKP